MNPIDTLFQTLRAAKRKAFMPFVTVGDPDLAFTRDLIPAVAESGADLIEVGFPFSDPIADGPVIQASYTRALAHQIKLADIFATLGSVKPGVPLVSMASYSLMFKRGPAAFIDAAKAAGVSGAVVPDLPVEEAEELSKLAADRDFKLILLVTPTTSPARAAKVVKACSGFVYVVSVVGITGERAKVSAGVPELLARLRTMTDLPLCVGFGVSRPEHVRDLKEIADGVIVGSALVKKLEAAGTDRAAGLASVRQLVKELSGALA
ncbi:tryptophan synthase subunit alpha : Tryptophan synthase alpha chain OS=Singulisphaera acidiphila (strain ATCC BAA-1392 / DSM 18658 / VKM B-2454 / MOB10) GN=trpA PE=3 SV=1: Trp_syntA [Gemmataceae bacterium]|nr:tryptophan synthase subunit alpha : Tryptophan synthase alpha chain OS=Singulisphaera acidiphila (strain ATCC BAA-1392 / DSM 18658 / VKM B-2454 / MOB10) GN=trpA PE=3 SV=1: Trp_syntA [Gemmataceae bacterium]VTU00280.1 tryptophan synthase subunit alpha : Tryptophan synthase alpha chain OS=Singulisphaera acidiphila (strain ATCC BAA-1392 / DSM 18658 / VKM B-2454 / MOB10) GN=trpA PE=3 SV=1: Trp_syntA [Gemmataceae bacterium]